MDLPEVKITVPRGFNMTSLLGTNDKNLRKIEENFDAKIVARGDSITFSGEDIELEILTSIFTDFIKCIEETGSLSEEYIDLSIELFRTGEMTPESLRKDILLTYKGKTIRPKTAGQKRYTDAIKNNTIIFGIGPAGTGKTYLAMAMAVSALKQKEVGKIILTRPVVEAGESLGYLPGTLNEKVDPYVRPLYDALFDMLDAHKVNALIDTGEIEIAPLAYMRGRTLSDSFVILDEAQNATPEQLKMFLTRLGFGSKMVVTGDITQIDLPRKKSGLKDVKSVLDSIKGIEFCTLGSKDVVRHGLVQRIVAAYDRVELETKDVKLKSDKSEKSDHGSKSAKGENDTESAKGDHGSESAKGDKSDHDSKSKKGENGSDSAKSENGTESGFKNGFENGKNESDEMRKNIE